MPDRSRDAAIERLRKAAHRVLGERRRFGLTPISEVPKYNLPLTALAATNALEAAWREFPECERDDSTPSPESALEMCEAYDRQKAGFALSSQPRP